MATIVGHATRTEAVTKNKCFYVDINATFCLINLSKFNNWVLKAGHKQGSRHFATTHVGLETEVGLLREIQGYSF
jgi:hypothetical protein